MADRLAADNAAHDPAEEIIKEPDQQRDQKRDDDNDERVRDGRPPARPDDMSELFAHMLQIREG